MIQKLKDCFSREIVNTSRQLEIDLAKGFAIIFMVWSHVYIEFGIFYDTLTEDFAYRVLAGPLAAPIFMICMGVGICYSHSHTPRGLAIRGVKLLAIGALLVVTRDVIPTLLWLPFDADNYVTVLDLLEFFLAVDILQFAGLSFLFIAFAEKKKWGNGKLLIFGILASLLGTVLRDRGTGIPLVDMVLGFIWGTCKTTMFPFLNWIIFPIVGVVFGQMLCRCKDKKTFYKLISPGALAISAVYIGITFWFELSLYYDYYFLHTLDAIMIVLLFVGLMGQNYWMASLVPKCKFTFLRRLSRNITPIFCIHHTILGFLWLLEQVIWGKLHLKWYWILIIFAVVFTASDLLAELYRQKRKQKIPCGK